MKRGYILLGAVVLVLTGWLVTRVSGRFDRQPGDSSRPGPAVPESDRDGFDDARRSGRAADGRFRERWQKARVRSETEPEGNSPKAASVVPWVDELLRSGGSAELDEEFVEQWLRAGHTNAADLLAIRQAGGSMEYLERALKEFPNDPRVLLASSPLPGESGGREGLRERLERLKKADPDNALADYVSAWNEFKSGNRDKALEDVISASAKKRFDDYTLDAARGTEALLIASGKSAAAAKAAGSSTVLLPHLSQLKQLSKELADLQGQFVASGDAASAERLARMGVHLGEHLADGPGSMTLISELVGIAIGKISVGHLDPGATYEFLGGTPREYLARLDERRSAAKFDPHEFESWMRRANEAEILAYYETLQTRGESAAMTWLRQEQNQPPAPPPP